MKTILILFLLVLSFGSFSQSWKEYIEKNALTLDTELKPDTTLLASVKKYRLTMMGEMHGTLEPAKMVEQLARLLLMREDSISIGLEIPEKEMIAFLKKPSLKTLKSSTFFSKPNEDGRNSRAWFELVRYCLNEPRICVFFYDNTTDYNNVPRDSVMYHEIKKHALAHPENKILTISGNLHNQLVPHNQLKTMGSYLYSDSAVFPPGSICSIYHYYSEGTMLNNTGNGLQLSTIEFRESDFTSGPSENYLLFYETDEPTSNNCIFFTRKIHHSESIDPKK